MPKDKRERGVKEEAVLNLTISGSLDDAQVREVVDNDESFKTPCTITGLMAGLSGGSLGYVFGFGERPAALRARGAPGRQHACDIEANPCRWLLVAHEDTWGLACVTGRGVELGQGKRPTAALPPALPLRVPVLLSRGRPFQIVTNAACHRHYLNDADLCYNGRPLCGSELLHAADSAEAGRWVYLDPPTIPPDCAACPAPGISLIACASRRRRMHTPQLGTARSLGALLGWPLAGRGGPARPCRAAPCWAPFPSFSTAWQAAPPPMPPPWEEGQVAALGLHAAGGGSGARSSCCCYPLCPS